MVCRRGPVGSMKRARTSIRTRGAWMGQDCGSPLSPNPQRVGHPARKKLTTKDTKVAQRSRRKTKASTTEGTEDQRAPCGVKTEKTFTTKDTLRLRSGQAPVAQRSRRKTNSLTTEGTEDQRGTWGTLLLLS